MISHSLSSKQAFDVAFCFSEVRVLLQDQFAHDRWLVSAVNHLGRQGYQVLDLVHQAQNYQDNVHER